VHEGARSAVTSDSDRSTGPAQHRFFQRTWSWFALGAPLELLSPLAVMRVIVVLFAVPWPLLALAIGIPHSLRLRVLGVTVVSWLVWAALARLRTVTLWTCDVVLLAGAVGVATMVSSPGWSGLTVAYSVLLAPLALFAGLFFRGWRMPAHFAVVAIAFGAAVITAHSPVSALATTAAVLIGIGSVEAIVLLLARSARRHDTIDPDTGLPNGFGLAVAVSRRAESQTLVVAVIRISGLNDAREALGWVVGTELLRRAVEDLGRVLPQGATIGRVEGDEIVVVLALEDVTVDAGGGGRLDDAVHAAGILATDLGQVVNSGRYLVNDVEVGLRAHVGTALAPWDGTEMVGLMRRATLSARRAEASGEHHRIWDGNQEELTGDDLSLLADLRLAGARGELWLAYQPQVASVTKRIVAVESLLRWDSPKHGSVPPGDFIPLAERTGLIERLSEWVLGAALDAQVRWRSAGIELPVSVNLSAKLLTRTDLVDWVLGELDRRGLPTSVLTIEVTETAETVNLSQAVGLLRPLHELGVRVSMDDFGCGYTSLASLPYLPLDELKVDRRFVNRSATSVADDAIVRAIGELAHRLGLHSVAEGVEDDETADRLTAGGFDVLQGFLYSRPIGEAALLEYVSASPVSVRPD
jgi:EAL domain-containing protein (putative c-di-GMP-specific phosphodiesterase class I)/GGDEF domain-containing protein